MITSPQPALVIFAADVDRVARFYRDLASMHTQHADADHVVLNLPGFELVIHRLHGGTEPAASPVQPREDSWTKVCLPVADITAARRMAATLGGLVKDASCEWEGRGFRACDGHDPAGNVIQVRAATAAVTAADAMPESPTLVGSRCTLRALVAEDAPSIARHANDPQVAINLFDGFPQPYTLAHAQAWCGDEHRRPVYGHVFAIDVDGEAIGCIGVVPEKGLRRTNAEVGYWIGRGYWRQGIGTEALRLLSAWAWQALPDVMRLYAPIYARNAGSQGVSRAAGYVFEGRTPMSVCKDGQVIDGVLWGQYRAPPA